VLLVVLSDEIMVFLYSDAFSEGGTYLRILMLHGLSLAFIDLFASALNARGEAYLSGASLFACIVVGVFVNIFLVSRYGAIGAAYASALTGLLGAGALGILVYRRFESLMSFRTCRNATVAVLILAVASNQLAVTGSLMAVSYLGCLVIYVLALVLLGEVSREDLESFVVWRSRQR
jgi:O-antigen/teichoic acid export membrane protein